VILECVSEVTGWLRVLQILVYVDKFHARDAKQKASYIHLIDDIQMYDCILCVQDVCLKLKDTSFEHLWVFFFTCFGLFIFSIWTCAISRNQFHTAVYICVCVFIASGIMACSHVRRVTEPEEGIDDFRPPPPFSPLPVFLSPSFLPWSICLLGRQEGLLFLTLLPETRGKTLPEGCVSSWLGMPPPVPLLFRRPLG